VAEITRRRVGELVRGVFKVLLPHPDGLPAKTVLSEVQSVVPPSDFENTMYPTQPNVRRYEKIIRFSTINAVKAGWLLKGKGIWSLTEEGRQAYKNHADPEEFSKRATQLYKKWKQEQPELPEEIDAVADESSGIATTIEEAEEAAWSQIESHLTQMNPYDFQNLVAGLLRGMGYHIAWIAPPGPDRGTDVIAHNDPLGVTGPRIKVQVKRSGKMTVTEIRSFLAVLADSDVGLFVSSGGFTKEAEGEARHQEKRRIMLIHLERLFDLWVEHYQRIPEESRALLPLRAVHFLAPAP
jgi:restriction system protein